LKNNLDPKIDVFASINVVATEIAKEKINPKNILKARKSNIIPSDKNKIK